MAQQTMKDNQAQNRYCNVREKRHKQQIEEKIHKITLSKIERYKTNMLNILIYIYTPNLKF